MPGTYHQQFISVLWFFFSLSSPPLTQHAQAEAPTLLTPEQIFLAWFASHVFFSSRAWFGRGISLFKEPHSRGRCYELFISCWRPLQSAVSCWWAHTSVVSDQQTLPPYTISSARVLHRFLLLERGKLWNRRNKLGRALQQPRLCFPGVMSYCLHLFWGNLTDYQLPAPAGERRADAEE